MPPQFQTEAVMAKEDKAIADPFLDLVCQKIFFQKYKTEGSKSSIL